MVSNGVSFVCSEQGRARVILFTDNFGPHLTDLCDVRNQVTVVTLPQNCTSLFQPMDMDIFAALKATYKKKLVEAIFSIFTVQAALQEASNYIKPETKEIDEGHDSHILGLADILLKCWDDTQSQTIARCWVEANILPRGSNAELIGVYGKLSRARSCTDIVVAQLVSMLASMRISVDPKEIF